MSKCNSEESLQIAATGPASSLVELLRERAARLGDNDAFVYLHDGEHEHGVLSYRELERRACAIAARLQRECEPGQRALLLYPSGLEYICAFFGCLFAGVIAVPVFPPTSQRNRWQRIDGIAADAGATWVLGDSATLAGLADAATGSSTWSRMAQLATDSVSDAEAAHWRMPAIDASSVAFLQYTSGSTGEPKGVVVSHANLLHNQHLIRTGFRNGPQDVVVGWLPLYHDMGLIGNILQPIYLGAKAVLMSPMAFLQQPMRWLRAIAKYRGTVSGGPNFAYELCAERAAQEQLADLDLSCWRVAFNGAEPVRAATLQRFANAFCAAGFRESSFYSCYGLAEATLFASGSEPGVSPQLLDVDPAALREKFYRASRGVQASRLVSSGRADPERLCIVDPHDNRPVPDGGIGEIWLRGASVAQGYWRREEATSSTFGARTADGKGRFLRTGDLGFVLDGQLYVTGRIKELIIVRGRNYYPQDIEHTAQHADPALAANAGAAFSIEVDGTERVVLVQEIRRDALRRLDARRVEAAVRSAVGAVHEVLLHDVVLIKPMRLPKTSSGKIRRAEARALYLARAFDNLLTQPLPTPDPAHVPAVDAAAIRAAPPHEHAALFSRYLRTIVAEQLRRPAEELATDVPVAEFGLDSLSTIQLQYRLQRELGVLCPLDRLLGQSTLNALSEYLVDAAPDVALPMSGRDSGPLSCNQLAMWFLHQKNPKGCAHTIAVPLRIRQALRPDLLQRTWSALAQRHPILRTRYEEFADEPLQRVVSDATIEIQWVDATGWEPYRIETAVATAACEPWSLSEAAPLRVMCFACGADDHVMLFLAHHIAVDLHTLVLLLRQLAEHYSALAAGEQPAPDVAVHSPIDLALWQREFIGSACGQAQLAYWRERLAGQLPVLGIASRSVPGLVGEAGGAVDFELGTELSDALRRLARDCATTPHVLLLSAYLLFLYKYTGEDDICVGTPVSGRGRAEFADLAAFCANTVVIRSRLASDCSFSAFVQGMAESMRQALVNQDLPFSQLVEALCPDRIDDTTPLFQTLFTLHQPQALPEAAALMLGGAPGQVRLGALLFESCKVPCSSTPFDLSLLMVDRSDGYGARWEYRRACLEPRTVKRMAMQFRQLLAAIVAAPHMQLGSLRLHTERERQALLEADTLLPVDLGEIRPLASLVEIRAAAEPHAVALICGDQRITYADLDRRAGVLAAELQCRGIDASSRVAVCLPRVAELYIAILAVLKLGAAYVPIDPSNPIARRELILRMAQPQLLLARSENALDAPCRWLDPADLADSARAPLRMHAPAHPDAPAYVLYTSGSTGAPKGVLMRQGPLWNLLRWQQAAMPLAAGNRVSQFASIAFDVSFQEIFSTWQAGATLVVVDEECRRDSAALLKMLCDEHIGRTFLPVAVLQQLAQEALQAGRRLPHLHEIVCAGEQLVVTAEIREMFGRLVDAELHNHYGPTECHVVTAHVLRGDASTWAHIAPIGVPIANCAVRLLDRDGDPVPFGAVGEIYLGGAALALGYLGRGDLTAERFVPEADSACPGARLYRTGDLARRSADGVLEYLGRRDTQVKVRGFRVELAEIETAVLALSDVAAAAVVLREDQPALQQLVAYIVRRPAVTPSADIREALSRSLPHFMVPARVVELDSLPLTANGKVDRRALPAPGAPAADAVAEPRDDVEARLATAWREVLGSAHVGIHDDFFESGGHSLLATRLVSRVRREFAIELPVNALFEARTIAHLAQRVAVAPPSETSVLRAMPRAEPAPLSFAQQRLWFLDQLEGASSNYNMPAAFRLYGPLDVAALRWSFLQIVQRHEILRTRFTDAASGPVQEIAREAHFELEECDVEEADLERRKHAHATRPFDLRRGELLRATLLRVDAREHVLLVNMHHIVCDGWSIGVLVRELNALYAGATLAMPAPLAPLPLQYADYAVWQRRELSPARLQRQLGYWREHLADVPSLLDLPSDWPRPPVPSLRAGVHRFELDAELCARLDEFNRRHGVTLLMTLAAVFQTLLARISGQDDIVIGTPMANRDRAEIEDLIGFFVNTVALRSQMRPHLRFGELLDTVRRNVLAAQANQDVPFEQLVEELKPVRSLSHMPFVQVMLLVHDGAADGLQLPGLEIQREPDSHAVARFDLALNFEPHRGRLRAWFDYAADLYSPERVARLGQQLQRLLEGVLRGPDCPLALLPLLDAAEIARQMEAQHALASNVPCCVHELIERRVHENPDALAVAFGDIRLSHVELDRRANRLAHYLRGQGIGAEHHVGVWMERCADLVVCMLAIWKAGGVYVPLDPSYPKERLDYMVGDAGLSRVIVDGQLADRIAPPDAACICLDRIEAELARMPAQRPAVSAHPLQPAYVIYTSGSTGKPKGVQVLHGSLADLLLGMSRRFGIGKEDSMASVASASFGIAFVELLLPLVAGGHTRIVARERVLDTHELVRELQAVSLAHLVPSLMRRVLGHLTDVGGLAPSGRLRHVFVGGDAVAPTLLSDMASVFPSVSVVEFYGQTETTILSTFAPQSAHSHAGNVIGTRLDHAQVYVLDDEQQLLPQGSVGEICIAGRGVARGYLGRPTQTAERFLPHPFAREPGARLYRTGDLGRVLADGNIEYLGRADFQVNVRGFRIELGEIESALRAMPGVATVIVTARDDGRGDKQLVAYLVPSGERTLDVGALRTRLRELLPDYMMPAHFVLLDSLPLNANGKLDRRALPVPDPAERQQPYAAPRNECETQVAELWAEVLALPRIGIHDNFFEIGGHSLLAAQVMARVRQRFGIALGVGDFFEAQTVAQFALRLEAARRELALVAHITAQPDGAEELESFVL